MQSMATITLQMVSPTFCMMHRVSALNSKEILGDPDSVYLILGPGTSREEGNAAYEENTSEGNDLD